MALSPTDASRPTGILVSGRVGARTGIGTYINYLLGATILAATAIGSSLARRTPSRGTSPNERGPDERGPTEPAGRDAATGRRPDEERDR
jgi:hypothetical protein